MCQPPAQRIHARPAPHAHGQTAATTSPAPRVLGQRSASPCRCAALPHVVAADHDAGGLRDVERRGQRADVPLPDADVAHAHPRCSRRRKYTDVSQHLYRPPPAAMQRSDQFQRLHLSTPRAEKFTSKKKKRADAWTTCVVLRSTRACSPQHAWQRITAGHREDNTAGHREHNTSGHHEHSTAGHCEHNPRSRSP